MAFTEKVSFLIEKILIFTDENTNKEETLLPASSSHQLTFYSFPYVFNSIHFFISPFFVFLSLTYFVLYVLFILFIFIRFSFLVYRKASKFIGEGKKGGKILGIILWWYV